MRTISSILGLLFLLLNAIPLFAQNDEIRILKNIPPPSSACSRLPVEPGSFANWLHNLPLKPPGSPVLKYNGKIHKSAQDTTVAAVVNLDMQGRKLEQCMDILIRLYAEYMWQGGRAEKMSLPLPGNFWLNWMDWEKGIRPEFHGIQVKFKVNAAVDSSFENFENYLRLIYSESHTQQFYHNLKRIEKDELQIGDFIVSKGSKSHAVMVVDLVRNEQADLLALFGQGDTPACEFYIMNYRKNDPWFPVDFKLEKIPLPVKKQMTWDGLRRFIVR